MKLSTAIAVGIGVAALGACNEGPREERAENVEEAGEERAENIVEAAENRAENVEEAAENEADAIEGEGDTATNAN